MRRALLAATSYFLIVFAAGFVLGAVRTLWLAPVVGQVTAVAIELPAMIAASWLASGWVLRRFRIGPELAMRAGIGAIAFGLLMLAEFALFTATGRGDVAEFLGALAAPAGALGLAGQLLFAVFPVLRLRSR
jgi:hypothetical protein